MSESGRPATAQTRLAIIEAGLRGFGERGYAATSIREIAALAGTNVASISYHFGGKEGLRAACADHVVRVMRGVAGPVADDAPPPGRDDARAALAALVERMALFLMLRPEAGPIAGFVVREMGEQSPALDAIYSGLIENLHKRLCGLWGRATGADPESEAVRLAVFAAIGQVVYFQIGRPVVQRRMDWARITPDRARAVARTVRQNLIARIDADREVRS